MKLIIRILLIMMLLGLIAYFGACIYGNFFSSEVRDARVDMPSAKDAPYSFVIENTATVILADDYEMFGEEAGSQTYRFNGYWELVGNEFRYRDGTLTISEQTFGNIILKRRN